MDYLLRTVDLELDELLPIAPAVAIDGPKGVGKTDTARRRAQTTWFLDDPGVRRVAESDFGFATVPEGTLLVDEWQKLPQVWDGVRRAVDAGAAPGSFLLTGSASPVSGGDTHSGAGRILSLRMRPMALHERGLVTPSVSLRALLSGVRDLTSDVTGVTVADYFDAIVNSGFPGIRTAAPRLRRGLLNAYLARVIDRDLPENGIEVRRPETLRRWLSAYAAASSTTTAYSRILDATTGKDGHQPAKSTTIVYRDQLAALWLLDPVPGWLPANNALRRLQQASKHQLADPALAARLLGVSASSLAANNAHLAGPLFESLVTLTIRVCAQVAEASVFHLRRDGGRCEVDLIVEDQDGNVLAVEVKLSPNVSDHDVRHLVWLREQVPDRVIDTVVVTTGRQAYRRGDGVAVVPLALLGP